MPSSSFLQGVVGRQPISTSFQTPHSFRPNMPMIGPNSVCGFGDEHTAGAAAWSSQTYPGTNTASGFMFCIAEPFLVEKVWWVNGTTATTNAADVGVYTEAGTTLLVSGGSTNIATANVVQEKDCTDTLLPPGRYWLVYNQNGTTATPMGTAMTAPLLRAAGCAQFAGAVSLGSTFTPAAYTGSVFPLFGIASRTQVA